MGAAKVVSSITGADKAAKDAARAAGGAAMAQQREARGAYNEFKNLSQTATTQGLASLDQDIQKFEKAIGRQEQLAAQIDPTIVEASQQALRLLRGEEARSLAPVQQQRQKQRQGLLNTLREQLGPGAETSSAGIQALTAFDQETSSLMAGAQQSALSQLGGLATQFSGIRPDEFRGLSALSGLGQQRSALQMQQAEGLFRARQPLLGTAGAQFIGSQIRAQHQMAQNQAIMGLAGTAAGFALGGPMGGALGGQLGSAAGGGSSIGQLNQAGYGAEPGQMLS